MVVKVTKVQLRSAETYTDCVYKAESDTDVIGV